MNYTPLFYQVFAGLFALFCMIVFVWMLNDVLKSRDRAYRKTGFLYCLLVVLICALFEFICALAISSIPQ